VFNGLNQKKIRSALSFLQRTPLHPQWHAFDYAEERLALVKREAIGQVLDVGCGRKLQTDNFSRPVEYIGLDYDWGDDGLYDYSPNVLADAHALPFISGSMDSILLLEVLEHLKNPEVAIKEAFRVLKPEGILLVSVPFLYPLHDEPHDYRRWTRYGLELLVRQAGGRVERNLLGGGGGKTVALMYNLAVCKSLLDAVASRRFGKVLMMSFGLFTIPVVNILAACLHRWSEPSGFMAIGTTMLCRKF